MVAAAAFASTAPSAEAQAEAGASTPTFSLVSSSTYSAPLKATVTPAVPEETVAADEAVEAAASVTSAAASVQADIAASGLDIGEPDTSVDTAALEEAAARLDAADALPAPLVPSITEEVTELIASVDSRVNQLRGSLDGAAAKKAEEEAAAEQARIEAEAAAAEAAEAAASAPVSTSSTSSASTGSSSASAPSAPIPSGGTGGDNSPEGAKATAYAMLQARGWGDDQYSCLVSLWNKESGWNYQAMNRSSGAYGIPQALPGSKMSSAGADWQTNAATQISWGLGYISGRYGTPCGAWGQSQSVGWY
ncbi:lytic transglycosylase domain-containing protein [Microbacterium hatanonis]|uniref:Lytic transglycosylase domain-containing protein n=1 Tax=Microbacterium hatanonis TaxID=404366 RepID=A0A5C8I6D9_9MICO|nr:lytic transglycosylase domain-containing protein [Microbacterium hatanonis]